MPRKPRTFSSKFSAPQASALYRRRLFFEPLEARRLLAVDAALVKDINIGGDSFPDRFTEFGGYTYFRADDGITGLELWRTDGTAASLFADLHPTSNSDPNYLTVANGRLFFTATTPAANREVWATDGVSPPQVFDVKAGSGSSLPESLTSFNGELYFVADNGTGRGIWHTNGVAAATLVAGTAGLNPTEMIVSGGKLYFAATPTAAPSFSRLYSYDGLGSLQMLSITSGSGSYAPKFLADLGGTVYFSGSRSSATGDELFKVTGPTSVDIVMDINSGPSSSSPDKFTVAGTNLFFKANNGTATNLWRTFSGGTQKVSDSLGVTVPGTSSFASIGSLLYFVGNSGGTGIFTSDGTTITSLPLTIGMSPDQLTNVGGQLYFIGTKAGIGRELWYLNGNTPTLVKDIVPGSGSSFPDSLKAIGSSVYFMADDGVNGSELWIAKDFPPSFSHLVSQDAGGNLVLTDSVNGADNITIQSNGSGGWTIIAVGASFGISGTVPAGVTAVGNTIQVSASAAASFNKFIFNTNGGSDKLTVNLASGDAIPNAGIDFNGGNPSASPGDKLEIIGGSPGAVTYNYTNANSGNVMMSLYGTVNYTGLEPVLTDFGTPPTTSIFNLPAGTVVAFLEDDAPGNNMSRLRSSPATFEATTFTHPSASLTINGGAGDSLVITLADSLTAANLAVTGMASISVGNVVTVGDVSLTATGAITEDAPDIGVDITAGVLTLSAGTGIGSPNALETTVASVTASTSAAGGIQLSETDTVTLTSVTAANGPITITTGGTTLVTSVVSSTDNDANDISITASAGDVTFGTIHAGTTAGDVTVIASLGSILDFVGSGTVITADVVTLTAGGEIGQPAANEDIDTTANSWVLSAGNVSAQPAKGIWITETSGVTITSASTVDGVIVADAGTSMIATSVTAAGTGRNVRLRALGGSLGVGSVMALGDVVSLSAMTTISDGDATNDVSALSLMMSAGNGIATAGDPLETMVTNLAWNSGTGGAFVANTGALIITSVTAFSSTVTGGIGSGAATISAASPITVASNVTMGGAIILTATDSALPGDDLTVNSAVTSTGSTITLNAGDNAIINGNLTSTSAGATTTINVDAGDADPGVGASLTIANASIISTVAGTFLNGNNDAAGDSFTFRPQSTTAFNVDGNDPSGGNFGDTLNLDLTTTSPQLAVGGVGAGQWTFTSGHQLVHYQEIEQLGVTGSYHLTLNFTGVDDLVTVRRGTIPTQLEVERTGVGPVTGLYFSGNIGSILSLTLNTLGGNDTVTVDDVNGLPDFAGTLPSGQNNPLVAGTPEFLYNGGTGINNLAYNLAATGTAQVYGFGSGAVVPVLSEGEVATSNTAGPSTLVAYFTGLGSTGTVTRSGVGASPGSLSIIGDNTGNSVSVNASADTTSVNPGGYTPLSFSPGNNYSDMSLVSLAGSDTYNINGVGPAGLDNLLIPVVVTDASGNDSLLVNDSTDTTGDVAILTQFGIDGLNPLAGDEISFDGIETLDVTGTIADDTLTTSLGGAVASPTNFAGLVNVNIRGNGGEDNLFLHVADSATNASLDFVNLFGDAGDDNFGGAATGNHIRPVLASGQTQILLSGDANAKTTGPVNPGTDPVLTGPDHLFLDMTTTDSGAAVLPIVIVDTNGGYADAANTQSFRYNGIEDINLYDNGVLTNTAIGDFFLRATDQADSLVFMSAAEVNPKFRIRVGNLYYPTSGGMYGPYMTGGAAPSSIYVYGRGGNDTINMYNTRLNAAFFGEAGDDLLTGGYNNDLLVGGLGNDRLNGGSVGGNDTIWGDDFNPAVDDPNVASQAATVPGQNNDQINTFGGNDTIYGQGGNDIINTGAADDYISGGAGDDQIDGQAGNDRIYGGAGNDVISGSDGNDLVAGNDGNDTLYGRVGNDILIGGLGQDIVNGNEGGDALVGDESNNGGSKSLSSGDAVDIALKALLAAWGTTPAIPSLDSLNSSGPDGSVDTLWGGTEADAFFGLGLLFDLAPDRNSPGNGPDLN